MTVVDTPDRWPHDWRGQWIWDGAPAESYWWRSQDSEPHFTYLRARLSLAKAPASLWCRVTCDSRYVLYVNGQLVGRGPIRGEPEFLSWDTWDIASRCRVGTNVVVALCHFYSAPGPWWIPAAPLGTLGRGSFCFETAPVSVVDLVSGDDWRAVPTPWVVAGEGGIHSVPSELIDGRRVPGGLHDPDVDGGEWPRATVLSGKGHGTVLDRPPAAPYMSPLARPIPPLRSVMHQAELVSEQNMAVQLSDDPATTWDTVSVQPDGDRVLTVWDVGGVVLGHVKLEVKRQAAAGVSTIDVVCGEDLTDKGLVETRPRRWAGRVLDPGEGDTAVTFFDPVGLRFVGVHHERHLQVEVEVEETTYPRPSGASFECDDDHLTELWGAGLRTVDVCSTDAFLDCPGREQRAWVADSYPQILVSLVTNPDLRLVRHHLALCSRSRLASGLLAGAAGCDFSRIGFTMPEYSLHWIRALARYWEYTGDEEFVGQMLPVADDIIQRYEIQRGPSGLLEDFGGWVFLDWAQIERDVVTGAHDALYVAALEAYADLPGAADVSALISTTIEAFELLWDGERGVYVDAVGKKGKGRRVSQHTNGAALLSSLVPSQRVNGLIERIVDPSVMGGRGRLVITDTTTTWRDRPDAHDWIPVFQYRAPTGFDEEADMVAAQPWFCRFLHEAYARHGRPDLVLAGLRRWQLQPGHGTLGEFWEAEPGAASRCHGWSTSPTFDLITYVLGVKPAAPGFAQGIIEPHLGDLTRARGRISTPHGWLSVDTDTTSTTLDIPSGLSISMEGGEFGPGTHSIERA